MTRKAPSMLLAAVLSLLLYAFLARISRTINVTPFDVADVDGQKWLVTDLLPMKNNKHHLLIVGQANDRNQISTRLLGRLCDPGITVSVAQGNYSSQKRDLSLPVEKSKDRSQQIAACNFKDVSIFQRGRDISLQLGSRALLSSLRTVCLEQTAVERPSTAFLSNSHFTGRVLILKT